MPRASNGASTSMPNAPSRFSAAKMSPPFASYSGSTRFASATVREVPS
jgi:hypothetical protein